MRNCLYRCGLGYGVLGIRYCKALGLQTGDLEGTADSREKIKHLYYIGADPVR